jgi:2-polyprenyl-6-hydroxyphenyl methylase/3-demethylubiquinone-9 3-methyltransferase
VVAIAARVNNRIYESLGARWYEAADDPVALLRAEAALHVPWVAARLPPASRVLDVGCGAGFLSNALAARGHAVHGIDVAADGLRVARGRSAGPRGAAYVRGDALRLPFATRSFDAVCALDFLEHVDQPQRVVAEAARVLRPGGAFFFHTFNRNPLAWLVVIKGVEWFVKNTPPDMHVLRLFVKPRELGRMCRAVGLEMAELVGSRPTVDAAFWRMLRTRVVPKELTFRFTRSTALSYVGMARRAG